MPNLVREKAPVFPISKVKKIAKCDPEYIITSNAAISATAFATELFVQNLVEESLVLAQLNSKGKTSLRLSLNSIEECVEKRENFRFLEDVIKQLKNNSALAKRREPKSQSDLDRQQAIGGEPQPLPNDDEAEQDDNSAVDEGEEEEEGEDEESEQEETLQEERPKNSPEDDKPARSVASLLSRFQYKSTLDVGEHSGSSDEGTDDGKNTYNY